MATIADLLVKIGADTSDLRKELNATKRQIRTAFGTNAMNLSSLAEKSLAGIGAGMAALGVYAVKAAADLQSVETAFKNMLGSGEKAKDFIGELQTFAAKTPFEFDQVSKASQKFLAFGFTAEQIIPTLTAVGDAAAGVGLGAEGIDRVTLALGQMAAKSKVQAGEMLQLTETGIPAWQMLADAMNVSVSEAMDRVSKGSVDAATGITALVQGMESTFGGMMEEQSKTIAGSWSSLMDGLQQSAAQVGLQIADALDLTDTFQYFGNILTNFASTVSNSGIAEAFKTCIPVEFQVGLITLGTVILSIAIPAIALLVANIAMMVAPFVAAAAAAAPFVAIAIALGGGLYYLYTQGVTVASVMEFMGVNTEKAGELFSDFGAMISEVGDLLVNLLRVSEPVFDVLGVVAVAAFTVIMNTIGYFINCLINLIDLVVSVVTNIIAAFNWMLDGISGAISSIGSVLSDMANSVLPSWASSALSTIAGFVSKAISWLSSLIEKITETNAALGGVGGGGGEEGEGNDGGDSGDGGSDNKPQFQLPDYSQFKTAAPESAPAGGGGGGDGSGRSSGGGGGSGGVDRSAQEAAQVSQNIEREYNRAFQSRTAAVDAWYADETKKLEASQAANENYERDKTRLVELYSQKRLAAAQEEANKNYDIMKAVRDAAMESRVGSTSLYGEGSQKDLVEMENDYTKTMDSIEDRWRKLSSEFTTLTAEQKDVFLKALADEGVAYETLQNGEVSFAKQVAQDKLAAEKEYQEKRLEYFQNCKDVQADIEAAYNALSLEELQQVLTDEAAMRLNNMNAEKELLDVYQQAYLDSHATTMELVADLAKTSLDGLATAFTDILTGAANAKEAFQNLGKAMLKTIASYFSQMIAGMIMTSIFGKRETAQGMAQTQADATQAAAVLAPAAWLKLVLHPAAGPIATGILSSGVSSSVGIGLAASTLSIASGAASVSKANGYAKGGYFTKPLFGILGDAGDEVALPLNRAVFRNIAEGITAEGNQHEGNGEVHAVLNNYGDINTGADMDDLFEEFNDTLASGLRGAR